MDKRARVYAAFEGQPVDQVPLTLWQHFYKQEQNPTTLASATLAFYHKYDLDLIKLTPNPFYGVEDWGADIVPAKNDDSPPTIKRTIIKKPEDWRHLSTLNAHEGGYEQALQTIRLIADKLGEQDAPFLMTIFSPLTLAFQLAGESLLNHIQNAPTDVHIGLATIAETTSRFADAALDAGADGIFFTSDLSQSDFLSEELCETFIVRYDLIALERVKSHPAPLVLHLSGQDLYFETVNQYPVHAVSWQQHATTPSLEQALTLTDKTLMTGPSKELLNEAGLEIVAHDIQKMIALTGGQRFILALDQELTYLSSVEILNTITTMNRIL